MERRELDALLQGVAAGEVSVDEAAMRLRVEPYSDLGFAKVDHHRGIRQGVSEVIYGAGKSSGQVANIIVDMLGHGQQRILITRIDEAKAREVSSLLAESIVAGEDDAFSGDDTQSSADIPLFTYYDAPQLATVGTAPEPDGVGAIVIAAGGTSDVGVAEEAALTAEMLGNEVVRLYDVGVAGLHRLLSHADDIATARVIIAVAGMEGALPSVIGGLASCPVIAVPTSVGYGASFDGLAALLAMLNSCASGVSVVNIDNGFGAGYQASLINHLR